LDTAVDALAESALQDDRDAAPEVVPVAGNADARIEEARIEDARIEQKAQVRVVSAGPPDQQEIQRRRELVRTLFNDFWNGSDEKPATFADRLNLAESYVNERLTAAGEIWQLDAKTRKILGLPPSSS
jgi:hypothetical protein